MLSPTLSALPHRKPTNHTGDPMPAYNTALIVGAGSGLSASLARVFAKAGLKIALAARSASRLDAVARETGAATFSCDAVDRDQVVALFDAVTDKVGLSAKRFIERFKSDVGLTPKRYCRIRRFQRAVTLVHQGSEIDWAAVALDCGYFDQAHFIHDFKSFAGLTPTSYQAARTSFQNHVKFLQSDGGHI